VVTIASALLLLGLPLATAQPAWPAALAAGASALVFSRLPAPASALLVLVPFAALANLDAWIDPGAAYPSVAILLAAVAVVARRQPRAFRFRGGARIALAYGLCVGVAALAAIWTDRGAGPWGAGARLLQNGFLAATLAALGSNLAARTAGSAARWSWAAALASGLLGALALGEAALDWSGGVPPIGRPVGGSELLALHVTLLSPPALALVAARSSALSGARRRLLALLGVLAASGLVLSFSRSGWVGAWAAILGMGVIAIKVDRHAARRLIGLALVLAAGGALAGLVLGGGTSPLATAYGDRLGSLMRLDLFADRRAEWARGLAAVRAHPWCGDPAAPNPYNLALGVAATSGLPALLCFGALAIASISQGLRVAGRRDRESLGAVGLLGATIALLVTGIGESTLGARLTPPAFATLGLLLGLGATAHGVDRKARDTR